MQCKYITTIEDLRSFCIEFKNELSGINGKCQGCIRYGKCLQICKEQHVDAALHMTENESRFPFLLKFIKSFPSLFWCVPARLYKGFYGTYRDYLPCQCCTGEEILKNIEKIEKVLRFLTDEYSKLVLLNILMYRLTLQSDYAIRAYSAEPQYFISSFRGMNHDEVYVDCGAYNGDSFIQYCEYNIPPKSAYLFEPDTQICKVMDSTVNRYSNQTNITIINKGVYKSTDELFFVTGKGMSNRLVEDSTESSIKVKVVAIDDIIMEDVSIIKMDIEGSEQNAILGAKNQILRNYPKLAISIYHSVKDLWEIPILIQRLFPLYSHFEIRHHTKYFYDTVLYVY